MGTSVVGAETIRVAKIGMVIPAMAGSKTIFDALARGVSGVVYDEGSDGRTGLSVGTRGVGRVTQPCSAPLQRMRTGGTGQYE